MPAPELLSIKERIERVIVIGITAMMADVSEVRIGSVNRWDQRGWLDGATHLPKGGDGAWSRMEDGDCLVIADEETAIEGGEGDGNGKTTKTLKWQLQVKISQAEAGTDPDVLRSTAQLHNRWLLRLETAILANPRMIEPEGAGNQEQLAVDTRVTGTLAIPIGAEQRESMTLINFETEYDHVRGDPAAGDGVTHYASDELFDPSP